MPAIAAEPDGSAVETPAALEERIQELEKELEEARQSAGAVVRPNSAEGERPESAEALADVDYVDRVEAGPFQFGGALRVNYIFGSYDDPGSGGPTRGSHGGTFAFDTFRFNVDFEYGSYRGLLEYRWYDGWNAPHTAWVGYRPEDESELQVGINRTPFGVGPYGAANSWFFNLDYYTGLADDMDLGVKYTKPFGRSTVDIGYYLMPTPHWRGDSRRSASYSYDVVDEGIVNGFNRERHQVNLRWIYRLPYESFAIDTGFSLQAGRLDNRGPGDDGWARAAAVHIEATRGRFNLKAQLAAYDYDVDNAEPGGNDDIVIMGAYDAPYEVASQGVIPSLGVSYTITPTVHWIDSIMFYNDVSALLKTGTDDAGHRFRDSFQNVTGAAVTSGKWLHYFDLAVGRGAPFVGNEGDNFLRGLSSNQEAEWNYRFNINIGYYF